MITAANREHSTTAASVLSEIGELRRIADRNVSGAKQTRVSTADLLRQAQALTGVMDGLSKKTH
jgi:methyl-accepting chemotaxis protein